jgi:hypothetical protein
MQPAGGLDCGFLRETTKWGYRSASINFMYAEWPCSALRSTNLHALFVLAIVPGLSAWAQDDLRTGLETPTVVRTPPAEMNDGARTVVKKQQ